MLKTEVGMEEIGVAVFDSGINVRHREFYGKNIAFLDVVQGRTAPYDDNGHGTHVAGIIAGRNIGIAKECKLFAVKVLDKNGVGKAYDVLKACEYVIRQQKKYNIRVANMSVGAPYEKESSSMLETGVKMLWDAGITVVCAAGNNGPKNFTITSPGTSKWVITVGSYDDNMYVDKGGKKYRDYSGRGPTDSCIIKPDFLALGNNVRSASANGGYTYKSGTSMAAPKVCGLVARILKKNPSMSPLQVKLYLAKLAVDFGLPANRQGFGLLRDDVIRMFD